MQRTLISDILEDLAPHDTEDKITILQTNNSEPLRNLLRAALDPSIQFDVDVPPYRKNKEVDGYASNNLMSESRRLYVFSKTANGTRKRKTEILGQILESIDPKDAILLAAIIRKDLSAYGVTIDVVNAAWPGLIP